jgi:hypothetical protein
VQAAFKLAIETPNFPASEWSSAMLAAAVCTFVTPHMPTDARPIALRIVRDNLTPTVMSSHEHAPWPLTAAQKAAATNPDPQLLSAIRMAIDPRYREPFGPAGSHVKSALIVSTTNDRRNSLWLASIAVRLDANGEPVKSPLFRRRAANADADADQGDDAVTDSALEMKKPPRSRAAAAPAAGANHAAASKPAASRKRPAKPPVASSPMPPLLFM